MSGQIIGLTSSSMFSCLQVVEQDQRPAALLLQTRHMGDRELDAAVRALGLGQELLSLLHVVREHCSDGSWPKIPSGRGPVMSWHIRPSPASA